VWWGMPVIPALRTWRQEDHKFEQGKRALEEAAGQGSLFRRQDDIVFWGSHRWWGEGDRL
jgi:hypothetical protein